MRCASAGSTAAGASSAGDASSATAGAIASTAAGASAASGVASAAGGVWKTGNAGATWRFGADERRLGGIGDVEPYLERYAALTGREIPLDELYAWEVLGNVKWAIGSLTQSRRHLTGEERSVELAILGRLAAEMEYELLDLIERAA